MKVEDPIVLAVMTKFYERSQTGITKYGTTLDRDDLSHIEWINHVQDELMDATLYLERLKRNIRGKLLADMMSEDEKDGLYEDKPTAVEWLIDRIESNGLEAPAGEYWNILKKEAIRLEHDEKVKAYNLGKDSPLKQEEQ